jgi:hypothetical protein
MPCVFARGSWPGCVISGIIETLHEPAMSGTRCSAFDVGCWMLDVHVRRPRAAWPPSFWGVECKSVRAHAAGSHEPHRVVERMPQIRFALRAASRSAANYLRRLTQGGALTDSHLPWATIVRPIQGFQFAALPTVGNYAPMAV